MKFRTTIFLLAMLTALASYVVWSERNKPAETTGSAAKISVLQLKPADISAIEVRAADGTHVRAEQSAGTWKLTAPKAEPADAMRVTDVISGLASLNASQVITPTSQGLAPYGLDKPAYEIALFGGSSALATLRVGSKNPNGNANYVQRADAATVYLISGATLDTVGRWLSDPPAQPTPLPTAPPLTVLPTTATTPTTPTAPTLGPASTAVGAPTSMPLPTATNPLSLTLPPQPTAAP